MKAKVTSVYDEGALEDTPLIGAKGFSVLVEVDGRRVLFDTGLRDRYLRNNLDNLDIDPASIDAVVISQSHPDNCRAINGLLDGREVPVDVWAPEGLYDGKRGLLPGAVGLSEENRPKANLRIPDGWTQIVPGVTLTPYFPCADGGSEAFLVVETSPLTVISGRGRDGPAKVLDAVSQHYGRIAGTFIGSILLEKRKKPVAQQYASDLSTRGCTRLYLNHSTGRDGMTNLRVHLGLKGVDEFYVGTALDL